MPTPINSAKYAAARRAADRKFGPKTSLYKSSYMVHQYIKSGGKYRGKRDPHHGIVRAFRTLNSKSRGKSRRM
jgi:hypothetical protein